MAELQVLVATMHCRDWTVIDNMNLGCSAVIANQTDREEIALRQMPQGEWKMISTATAGVGVNRNIALLAAEGDIVLFADDDLVYYDGMREGVLAAFEAQPDADVILFGIDILRGGKVTERRHLPRKRRHVWDSMRFGTVTMAARREAILRNNILFNLNFGGGCMYSAGEDSLFLKACFDRGLKVYSHDFVLGTCCKDTSSWFTAYNEKYFYDKGALMAYLFPRMPYFMGLYFGARFKRETDVPLLRRFRLVFAGIRGGRKLRPYKN